MEDNRLVNGGEGAESWNIVRWVDNYGRNLVSCPAANMLVCYEYFCKKQKNKKKSTQ